MSGCKIRHREIGRDIHQPGDEGHDHRSDKHGRGRRWPDCTTHFARHGEPTINSWQILLRNPIAVALVFDEKLEDDASCAWIVKRVNTVLRENLGTKTPLKVCNASFFHAEVAAFRGSTGGYCAPALPAVGAAGPAQLASSSGYRVLSFDHTEGCLQLEECAGCRKFHTDGVNRLAWCRGRLPRGVPN